MNRTLATLALLATALALAAPPASYAQALPDEVRSAGVTLAAWSSVQIEVKRSAADKRVSERALGAACAKMGIEFAKGRKLDLAQLIALIDSRADEINALGERLESEARESDPTTAGLLQQARAAIDAGELDQASDVLDQADATAARAFEGAQRKRAEVVATEAEVKSLELDDLAAAAKYAEAVGLSPPGDAKARWKYVIAQAAALERRGELFEEPQPLQSALGLYRDEALPLVPRQTYPHEWATTQSSLAKALRVVGERGDEATLHGSVAAYRASLEVSTRSHDPADWASAENGLGSALARLGERGDDQALREAVAAFHAAEEIWTREGDPADWARTQNNLGSALETIGERGGDDAALKEAVTDFRSALEVEAASRNPIGCRPCVESNLGNALEALGERGNDAALREAVAAYRNALQNWTRTADPGRWAMAEVNLGNALETLGERGDAMAQHDAVAADRAALEVFTRDRDPARWAMAEDDLGTALETQGAHGDAAALAEAVVADRAVLEVFSRDGDPADWAKAEVNLGVALERLGERGDPAALNQSIAAYRAALQVFTPAAYPAYAKEASANLARAEATLARRSR